MSGWNPKITYLRMPTLDEINYLDGDEADRLMDFICQADRLFNECHIGLDRGKEPLAVALHDQNVVGVVSVGVTGDRFSFDIAVDPDYRTGTIGTTLARMADREYRLTRTQNREAYGDGYHAWLWVVEPRFVRFFERLGYEVIDRAGTNTFMEKW